MVRVLFFFFFSLLLVEEGGHLGRQKRTLCLPQEAPGTRWNFDLPRDRSNLHVFLPRGKRYCLRAIAEAAIVQGFDGTSPTPVPPPVPSLSLARCLHASCHWKRNFFPCIRRVSRKARFKFGFALFVTDSPRRTVCKGFSLRELSNWAAVRVDLSFRFIVNDTKCIEESRIAGWRKVMTRYLVRKNRCNIDERILIDD